MQQYQKEEAQALSDRTTETFYQLKHNNQSEDKDM